MLERCKKLLRIFNEDFDDEIQDLILACKTELKSIGILESKLEGEDPLIKRIISIYVKRDFGWDNEDYEKLDKAYESLKLQLALSKDYKEEVI